MYSFCNKNNISKAAIVIAGADVKPIRLFELEKNLIGQIANEQTFLAAEAEAKKIDAISDAYYSAAYRQRLSATLVNRALKIATKRAGRSSKNG